MKFHSMSGAPARVTRWSNRLLAVMVAALFVIPATSSSALVPVANCIPSNDTFKTPLTPLFSSIFGALGGLIPMIAAAVIILLTIYGIVKVVKNENIADIFKVILSVPLVVIVGIMALIILNALYVLINNQCSVSPF